MFYNTMNFDSLKNTSLKFTYEKGWSHDSIDFLQYAYLILVFIGSKLKR